MALQCCMGATTKCSFGLSPSILLVGPVNRVNTGMSAANIMDSKPYINILPFGMCKSLGNPAVALATASALGVLTPMPCTPVTVAPWISGSPTVLLGGVATLNDSSKLICSFGGKIEITKPGQKTTVVP